MSRQARREDVEADTDRLGEIIEGVTARSDLDEDEAVELALEAQREVRQEQETVDR
jgi:hypothetical protein